jgi:hypothetical protein
MAASARLARRRAHAVSANLVRIFDDERSVGDQSWQVFAWAQKSPALIQ